ncbi:enoyl-CoA hydratase/isomerase family protein, partial [Mesorhizobium sp. M7D.F.Ca.US.004.03.1.1]
TIESLKMLTAHAVSGNLADGLAMERDRLGDLYRGEIGQQRVKEFADRSAARLKKAGS